VFLRRHEREQYLVREEARTEQKRIQKRMKMEQKIGEVLSAGRT
jgi:hypothetical protein